MKRLAFLLTAVVAAVLCVSAATATATPAKATHTTTPASAQATSGQVAVKFTIQKFVKTRHSLTALGTVLATFTPSDGSQATTVKQPFRAKVTTAARLF